MKANKPSEGIALRCAPGEPSTAALAQRENMTGKPNVLVVDDEAEWRAVIARCLEPLGVCVIHADTVASALRVLRERDVAVVILDMRMPTDLDSIESHEGGFRFLESLAKYGRHPHVLVFTAYPSYRDAFRCAQAGAMHYVPKCDMDRGEGGVDELRRAVLRALQFPESGSGPVQSSAMSEWNDARGAPDRQRRGEALESLCARIFGSVSGWSKLTRRVRTETEEIDLAVVNESSDEFWRRFGTLILVECKNWDAARRPGRTEFDSFYAKLARRGEKDCRLGFFVSLRGVARTFSMETKRIAKEGAVIVPLDEKDVWALMRSSAPSDLLKDRVVKVML